MSSEVVIADYGTGNLHSIQKAMECAGAKAILSAEAERIALASHLIIPGVGAFGDCVGRIQERGLDDPIRHCMANGSLVLGICVGMQMLFDLSEEFATYSGFGVIPGKVQAIDAEDFDGSRKKIPHIAWAGLTGARNQQWEDTILADLTDGDAVYFLHSFQGVPEDDSCLLAEARYGDTSICAAVRKGNVYGCQFHPEKSGPTGLKILRRFLMLNG